MRRLSTRTFLTLAALAVFAVMAASVAAADVHWNYFEHGGAADWGELKDDTGHLAFPDCNLSSQSPINIEHAIALSGAAFEFAYTSTDLIVTNNGHTIQVNYGAGSTMKINGKTYKLLQFHFHSPSEYELEGSQTAMEAHFVHQAADGELAVVGVMLVAGKENATLQKILDKMPAAEGSSAAAGTINGGDLMPAKRDFYSYNGSLTTPPCSEGVKWYVLSTPVEISDAQVAQFRALSIFLDDKEFVGNARPVQKLNGRQLTSQQPTASPSPAASASPTASASASPVASPTAAPSATPALPPTAVPPATPTASAPVGPTETRVAPAPPNTGNGAVDGTRSSPSALTLSLFGLALIAFAAGGLGIRLRRTH